MAAEVAGVDCEWRLDILRQLRQRNKRESGGFSELIASRMCNQCAAVSYLPSCLI